MSTKITYGELVSASVAVAVVSLGWLATVNNTVVADGRFSRLIVGGAYVVALAIGFVSLYIRNRISRTQLRLGVAALAFLIWAVGVTVMHREVESVAFYRLSTYVLCLSVLVCAASYRWPDQFLIHLSRLSLVVWLCILGYWMLAGMPVRWSGIYNTVSSLGFLLGFAGVSATWTIRSRAARIVIIVATLVLAALMAARAPILFIVAYCCVYAAWPMIRRNGLVYYGTFGALTALLVAFPICYVYVSTLDIAADLNRISADIFFGANFFSGRQYLWEALLGGVEEHWFWGDGLGTVEVSWRGGTFAAHSLYIQLAVQLGLMGISLFFLIALVVWAELRRRASAWRARIGASVFVGVLAQQSFEVSLLENNLSLGFWFWVILGAVLAPGLDSEEVDVGKGARAMTRSGHLIRGADSAQ